jgi:hypothetical protein
MPWCNTKAFPLPPLHNLWSATNTVRSCIGNCINNSNWLFGNFNQYVWATVLILNSQLANIILIGVKNTQSIKRFCLCQMYLLFTSNTPKQSCGLLLQRKQGQLQKRTTKLFVFEIILQSLRPRQVVSFTSK